MLFVEDKLQVTDIKVPRNCSDVFENYSFELYSQGTNAKFSFEVEDLSGISDYLVFSIDFSGVPENEYEYVVYGLADDEKLTIGSKGLIQIGKRTLEYSGYDDNRVYKEYIKR